MIRYMTFTMIIFRFEVALLLVPITVLELWLGNLKLFDALKTGIFTSLWSLGKYYANFIIYNIRDHIV
jgi:hypothetical protein